jgi:hypothetical protein
MPQTILFGRPPGDQAPPAHQQGAQFLGLGV